MGGVDPVFKLPRMDWGRSPGGRVDDEAVGATSPLKRGACSLGMFLLKFNYQESECLCRMMTHY